MATATVTNGAPATRQKNVLPAVLLADWTATMKRSILREMLAVVSRPGILSFAGGLPAPELFPRREYAAAAAYVLSEDALALQYGPPYEPLKTHIVRIMELRGVRCSEGQVFVTTGAQQALNILASLFLNAGSQVIVEEAIYTGFQQSIAPYLPHILTVPTDMERGIDVAAIEAHMARGARPAFLYVITDAHNPLGVSISPSRREQLVGIARRYHLPIIEDDPYGLLQYGSNAFAPLRAMDDQWVFYVGSFSKILAPALRLGWMIIPEPLVSKLRVIKEAYDLESSAFIQRSVSAYLDTGHFPGHLARLRKEYGQRRDVMLSALERHFPPEARWTSPSGGMFIWVELPQQVDVNELLTAALDEAHVAFIPGSAFSISTELTAAPESAWVNRCMRLNFSNCPQSHIEDGIAELGKIVRRFC